MNAYRPLPGIDKSILGRWLDGLATGECPNRMGMVERSVGCDHFQHACDVHGHRWLRVIRSGEVALLTEAEVQRSFRALFKNQDVPPETFDKAEALLDELRNESPLRHRLSVELEELRKMYAARA